MQNPALLSAIIRRPAALVALSVLAIIFLPVLARAHGHAEAQRVFLAGLHRPVAHAAHSFAHALKGPRAHGHGVHVHRNAPGVDGLRWSLRDGEFHSNCGISAEELRDVIGSAGGHGSILWISQNGDEWIIRDRALIQRARGSVEPMQRLGKEMGRLGGEMGRLGMQQGRFGAEMGRFGARQGVLAARLALLELRDEDDPAIEREAAAIEREMDELSRQQDEFDGRHDSSLEGRMDDLGARMDDLGVQMDRLGAQMEQLSQRAGRELKALVKEAIASRKAERAGHGCDL